MKKIALLMFMSLFMQSLFAQIDGFPENEVKINIFNTITIASVEIGYEKFVGFNQSVEAELLFNDRVNYHAEKGARKFNTNSLKIGYNYYFGTTHAGSGMYANPFFKYRFGNFEESAKTDPPSLIETNMNGFIVGIGIGYKWNSNDKFVLGPYASIGRNFNEKVNDRFAAIELQAGFSVGLRF
jgi:hypothetical protein